VAGPHILIGRNVDFDAGERYASNDDYRSRASGHDDGACRGITDSGGWRQEPKKGSSGETSGSFRGGNGVRLHYVSAGKGPLIIFLHGFPEFWYEWKNQLTEFGQDHLAVAPDMRGYKSVGQASRSGPVQGPDPD
jgi:hypothetical protein